jgi:23S rRNA pseudouridine1911/1915/1917 synthase
MTEPAPSPITLQSRIPNDAAGMSLLAFLAKRFRYLDKAGWLKELAANRIRLDDKLASGEEPLRGGMRLKYEKLHQEPEVNLNYRVIHQDDGLMAIDKPPHLPMHADGPFIRNTLIHRLREDHDEQLQLLHRLDRETSGICIVAANKEAQAKMQLQFHQSIIRKVYIAVVKGHISSPIRADQPIGHSSTSEIKLRRSAAPDAVHPKAASTAFEPIKHGPNKTLVRCIPETGRTHQIRVHLENLGYPIFGDKLYGHPDEHYLAFIKRMKAGKSVFEDTSKEPNRHLLHAHQIYLEHPSTDLETCYEAPIPEEFHRWLLS